jgi:VIT1/CCC1 family predicted Fe2+/Mn2+ transporter
LTERVALEAHVRDELGITQYTAANPLQAALASGASFVFGGGLPVLLVLFVPLKSMVYIQYIAAIAFLSFLGAVSAKLGGSSILPAVIRLTFWGTLAMGLTALIGYVFGVQIG